MSDPPRTPLVEALGREEIPIISPVEPQRPHMHLTPTQWVRQNLINTPLNVVLTVVFGVGLAYAAFRLLRFLFVTARWEIVRRNLRLFMVGNVGDIEHLRRLWISAYLLAAVIGFVAGISARLTSDAAVAAGRPIPALAPGDRLLQILRRFWPLIGAAVLVLSFIRTVLPAILLAGAVATLLVARLAGWRSHRIGRWRWLLVVAGLVAAVLVVSRGGVDWGQWGGFHLTLFATVVGVGLAFPFGLLMALGRQAGGAQPSNVRAGLMAALLGAVGLYFAVNRGIDLGEWTTWVWLAIAAGLAAGGWVVGRQSSLPAVRLVSIAYIELFRGVPLITLLFASRFLVPLFYPNTAQPPSVLARALVVIVLFEAAYVAENVRGGLQAIPRGQYEAAEALGMTRWKMTRRIILPQALRAVLPALVGQFISMFKDTSLLATVGFVELLAVAQIVLAQEPGQGLHTVTFAFAGLLYWAVSYTMSRESRRLETQLGVGVR